MIKPTTAAIMVDLAWSSLPLSPPDIIQRMPPQIKNMIDTTIEMTIRILIVIPIISLLPPKVILQRLS